MWQWGRAGAFTLIVCTDGLERTNTLDKIYEYSSTGTLVQTYEDPFPESHLRWQDIAMDADGLVYATSYNYNNVYRWDSADGSYVDRFTSTGIKYGQDAAFSADGSTLYVISEHADYGVSRHNGTTGAFIDTLCLPGTGSGVAVGPNGNIFTTTAAGSVAEYDATTGAYIDTWASGYGTWTNAPTWHDGDLYFSQSDRIGRVDGDKTYLPDFIQTGTMPNGANVIGGFDWGPDGNLYVCASANVYADNYIFRFNGTTGAYIDTVATLPTDARPTGIVFTPEPATMSLLLFGTVALLRRRRRA